MKSLQKILVCFVLILIIFGCGTTIKMVITSDPQGANVYMGDAPDNMFYAGETPKTLEFHNDKPYWKKLYYKIKKTGYKDSELIFKPQGAINADRYVHVSLKPLDESVVYCNPDDCKLYPKPSELEVRIGYIGKGTKLTVLDTKDNWYQVLSPNLGIGWVPIYKVVTDAAEIKKREPKIKPIESETRRQDEKLKSVILNSHSYIYTGPNFEGTELIFLDKGTKLTVLDTKDNWHKVRSKYFESGWIQTDRVVAETNENEKTKGKDVAVSQGEIKPLESETKPKDEDEKCAEVQNLSSELMSLISTFPQVSDNFHWDWQTRAYHPAPKSFLGNFKKVNGISLKILRLMDELRKPKPSKEIPDCKFAVHLTFCRKATVSYSGKGMIDRKDARIKYTMTAKAPAILLIDFTVMVEPLEVIGYGFSIISESPFVSASSSHVEFEGVLKDFTKEQWVKATEFVSTDGPVVTMGGSKMVIEPYFSVPYKVTVQVPKGHFFSKKGFGKGPMAYPRDFQWPTISLNEQDLQKAFEKERLILRRKTETKSLLGTVTIDFAPPDPELQASDPLNPGGIGLWGDRTTHGGFLLATGKEVFSDGHSVVKEGDPVLCPIHGLSKVSRDESTGVYIGDKTIAFEGSKADCGAEILSGKPLTFVQPVKQ